MLEDISLCTCLYNGLYYYIIYLTDILLHVSISCISLSTIVHYLYKKCIVNLVMYWDDRMHGRSLTHTLLIKCMIYVSHYVLAYTMHDIYLIYRFYHLLDCLHDLC